MGAIQPRHHLWRWGDGGYRKRPPSFLWYGGSCSSKIVLTVALQAKEKSSSVIPKVVAVAYGSGRFRELFIKEFECHFKRGFTKEVVTRTGRLRGWSQGQRRL